MSDETKRIDAFCDAVLSRKLYSNRKNLLNWMTYFFRYSSPQGKAVLDIGGGPGLTSLYAATLGARSVCNLEPDLRTKPIFEELASVLGFDNARFDPRTFQDFDPGDEKFDLICSHNSVNHLDEDAVVGLPHDPEGLRRYQLMFTKLTDMAAPGAQLIIADCTNCNLFASLGLRNPACPSIAWEKHQPPKVWAAMLQDAGWTEPRIRYTAFNSLGALGRLLMNNPLVNYMTTSHFCLVMRKA